MNSSSTETAMEPIELVRPLLVITSVLVNTALIVYHSFTWKKRQSHFNGSFLVLVVNLAVCNTVLMCMWLLPMLMWYITQWSYTSTGLYTTIMFLTVFSQCLVSYSTVSLVLLTLVHKVHHLSVKPTVIFVALLWVFCVILALPEVTYT